MVLSLKSFARNLRQAMFQPDFSAAKRLINTKSLPEMSKQILDPLASKNILYLLYLVWLCIVILSGKPSHSGYGTNQKLV